MVFKCRFSLLSFLLLLTGVQTNQALYAQFKHPSVSLAAEPMTGNRFIVYKGSFSQAYKDSVGKADRWRNSVGAAFWVSFKTGKTQGFHTGLQYQDLGFTRRKDNIRFLDTIHPQIGIMNDLSQTGGAYVAFKYRYRYLSMPLMFSNRISGKKAKNTLIHFMYGLSVSLLVKHDIKAELHGFSTRGGQKVHILDNSESQPSRINVHAQSGLRIENILYGKETWIFVQPELVLPAFSANQGNERYRLLALGIQIGLMYRPDPSKTE